LSAGLGVPTIETFFLKNQELKARRNKTRIGTLARMRLRRAIVVQLFVAGAVSVLRARVVRVEITSRQDVLAGQPFGAVGPYERITGRVHFAVAGTDARNRLVVDRNKAVHLKNSEEEFWSDFFIVRPKEMQRGNGTIRVEVPNRGRSHSIPLVDGG
jgi:hypothetical protein